MRMRGQNDINSAHPGGELAVDVEAVVGEQHHKLRTVASRFLHMHFEIVLANAERPVRDHPARIGDRGVRKRLSDYGDLHAAPLDHQHRLECRLIPFRVAHVLRQKRKCEIADELFHPLSPEREFPMADHCIGPQQRHAVAHVLAFADEGCVAVLPGVAAVQEHDAIATLLPYGLENCRDAIEPAEATVGFRQCAEISFGQRIGLRRSGCDAIAVQESLAADMRHQASRGADTEIAGRFAKEDRHELGMDVRDMNERDIPNRIKAQQIVVGEALLRHKPCPAGGQKSRSSGGDLQKLAPGHHAWYSFPKFEWYALWDRSSALKRGVKALTAALRPGHSTSRAQVTAIESCPMIVDPSSSIQVRTTGPDSCARNLNWM